MRQFISELLKDYISRQGDQIKDIITKSNGLGNDYIIALEKDRYNTLYIGTNGGGMSQYRHNEITSWGTENGLPSPIINRIHRIDDQIVILSGRENLKFNGRSFDNFDMNGNGLLSSYDKNHNHDIYSFFSKGVFINGKKLNIPKLRETQILHVLQSENGTLYIGTLHGVILVNKNEIIHYDSLEDNVIYDLIDTPKGVVFLTKFNLYLHDGAKLAKIPLAFDRKQKFLRSYAYVEPNYHVIGTSNGLFIQNQGMVNRITVDQDLLDDHITNILVLDETSLIITTNNGISVIDTFF